MDSIEAYKIAARYYEFIASGRNHFELQVRVVNELIKRYRLKKPRILDAACGSGEVLNLLLDDGANAYGCDGSPDMLILAQQFLTAKQNARLYPACKWQDLGSLLQKERFDLIFVLGHAFPLLKPAEIPGVIEAIFEGLNPDGVFAFDMRQWIRADNGQLRESGRPVDVRRWMGEHALTKGKRFLLDDCCTYSAQSQRITYSVQHLDPNHQPDDCDFTFEYTLFDVDDVTRWFAYSPFRHNIAFHWPKGRVGDNKWEWPFTVVVAKKRAPAE